MTDAFEAPDRRADATVLDELVAQLDEKVTPDDVALQVPHREGLTVRFRPPEDMAEIAKIRTKTALKGMPTEVAQLRFAVRLLITTCKAIVKNGQVLGSEEEPWTFDSEQLHDLIGTIGAEDTLRKFYGGDPFIVATANALLTEAGYATEVIKDPTAR